jgi:hypothetical protein
MSLPIKERAKRSRVFKISAERFAKLVRESSTFTEIARGCGLQNKGGNIHTVRRRITRDGLDASHIKCGLGSNKGKKFGDRFRLSPPLNEVMVKNSTYSRGALKRRLIANGMLKNECAICGMLPEWRGQPLVLRLDHKNGVYNDARRKNLRLLCPNCDSQTPTFAGRNKVC